MKYIQKILRSILATLLIGSIGTACHVPTTTTMPPTTTPPPYQGRVPDWTKNAVIYEVNIRQYTPEGTFKAFEKQLPRLQKMGVDILWLMPIHPIGIKNRKGTQGSYYAVRDYQAVNPEYGTLTDFKNLVNAAHKLGMKIIIDWVANHTAADNIWTKNKDWYTLNDKGEIMPPAGTDWWDVADLNYDNANMRQAMIEALQFWVRETHIDGYRCDVAMMVPTDFWNDAREALDQQNNNLFWLAEAEEPDLCKRAFDMSYGWECHHLLKEIAQGHKTVTDLRSYRQKEKSRFPNTYMMYFTTNHDENSWNGTEKEKFGNALDAFRVYCFVTDAMPLIYTGQESNLERRLQFFEKDPVEWGNYPAAPLFTKLASIKHENPAIWNGLYAGSQTDFDCPDSVYGAAYTKQNNSVITFINFADKAHRFVVNTTGLEGSYKEVFTNTKVQIGASLNVQLPPYSYQVFVRK
jgi:glycosidase